MSANKVKGREPLLDRKQRALCRRDCRIELSNNPGRSRHSIIQAVANKYRCNISVIYRVIDNSYRVPDNLAEDEDILREAGVADNKASIPAAPAPLTPRASSVLRTEQGSFPTRPAPPSQSSPVARAVQNGKRPVRRAYVPSDDEIVVEDEEGPQPGPSSAPASPSVVHTYGNARTRKRARIEPTEDRAFAAFLDSLDLHHLVSVFQEYGFSTQKDLDALRAIRKETREMTLDKILTAKGINLKEWAVIHNALASIP